MKMYTRNGTNDHPSLPNCLFVCPGFWLMDQKVVNYIRFPSSDNGFEPCETQHLTSSSEKVLKRKKKEENVLRRKESEREEKGRKKKSNREGSFIFYLCHFNYYLMFHSIAGV